MLSMVTNIVGACCLLLWHCVHASWWEGVLFATLSLSILIASPLSVQRAAGKTMQSIRHITDIRHTHAICNWVIFRHICLLGRHLRNASIVQIKFNSEKANIIFLNQTEQFIWTHKYCHDACDEMLHLDRPEMSPTALHNERIRQTPFLLNYSWFRHIMCDRKKCNSNANYMLMRRAEQLTFATNWRAIDQGHANNITKTRRQYLHKAWISVNEEACILTLLLINMRTLT